MQDNNPFKAPSAVVEDHIPEDQTFVPDGRRVPAGNGLSWLGAGWALFRKAPGIWIVISVIYMVLLVVLGMIPIINILLNLLVPIFTGGIMLGCKALEDGDELKVGHLFAGFSSNAGSLVLVGLLYLVGVIAVMLVAGAMMGGLGAFLVSDEGFSMGAMIVPALFALLFMIPLAMALWYAPALVVFHGQAPMQAMKASFFVALKNFVPFLVYGIAVLVLGIIASIPLALGWLVLLPVLMASIYTSYKDMFTLD